jgi:hypothetical protein
MRSKKRREQKRTSWTLRGLKLGVAAACVAGLVAMVDLLWVEQQAQAPVQQTVTPEVVPVTPDLPEIVDFHMKDLDRGVQLVKRGQDYELHETQDGGATWTKVATKSTDDVQIIYAEHVKGDQETVDSLKEGREITGAADEVVRKMQFATAKVGWALLAGQEGTAPQLWFTADGGATWQPELDDSIRKTMDEEQRRQEAIAVELPYYKDPLIAVEAMRTGYTIMPAVTVPGDVVLVRSGAPGKVDWNGRSYDLQPFGHGYYTYLPISMRVEPGDYRIGDQTLTVEAKSFETQHLEVTGKQNSMRQNTERIQADQLKINKARGQSQAEFIFAADSTFMQPVEGRLTTPYGYTRYVNGAYAGSHTAIDLAAPTGTPIYATNDGVVALADELYLTGFSIYIDHGLSLFSQYAHLSELKVKAGDEVKKGDLIGLVGSTGFSTGPHLHFTFWSHNVPVNPNVFFNRTPFDWLTGVQ